MSAAAPTDPPPGPPGDSSLKPYLLRALYDWAVDHGLTPQVLVDVAAGGDAVSVPAAQVKDGRIALNIHPRAVAGLEMGNDRLAFSARFGGKKFAVRVPVTAVTAIFCRENGQGIAFQAGEDSAKPPVAGNAADAPGATGKTVAKTVAGKTVAGKTAAAKPRRAKTPPAHLRLVK